MEAAGVEPQKTSPLNLVYHEKQVSGTMLCGQHVLNALLQGPYFGVEELTKIALELDKKEEEVIKEEWPKTLESGEANLIPKTSSNINESGNYSIQVLRVALGQHNLEISRGELLEAALKSLSSSEDVVYDENKAPAFICHVQHHWFAIRYINGTFWDLNSLYKKPERVSTFYLMAFLAQLKNEGSQVFLVHGKFPPPIRSRTVGLASSWFEIGSKDELIKNESAAEQTTTGNSQNSQQQAGESKTEEDDEEDMLQRAIELSLQKPENN